MEHMEFLVIWGENNLVRFKLSSLVFKDISGFILQYCIKNNTGNPVGEVSLTVTDCPTGNRPFCYRQKSWDKGLLPGRMVHCC